MKYKVIPTRFLLEQIQEYDEKTKRVLQDKKRLLKDNPFRNKPIESTSYNHVFRIRFSYQGVEKRLAYVIIKDRVFLCFVLDRSKDYTDLGAYFKKIGRLD